MPFNLGKAMSIATKALSVLVTAVPAVEQFQRQVQAGSGADKRASVLELVQAELTATERVAGRDLANDPEVLKAAGAVVDTVAFFHKLLAHKVDGSHVDE
jgi:hypothetical protein